jgi:Protein of unknown function (DUF3098)
MSDKKNTPKKTAEKITAPKEIHTFAFNKENYMLMIAGVVVLIIGFTLMAGTEDIFSTTKLTIAPIVVVIGFIIEFFAIMRNPKD